MNSTMLKFYTALTAALAIAGNAASDGSITLSEGISIAIAVLGSFGVYQFPNSAK